MTYTIIKTKRTAHTVETISQLADKQVKEIVATALKNVVITLEARCDRAMLEMHVRQEIGAALAKIPLGPADYWSIVSGNQSAESPVEYKTHLCGDVDPCDLNAVVEEHAHGIISAIYEKRAFARFNEVVRALSPAVGALGD